MQGTSPGERRGGRQKGIPNKKTQVVTETLEAIGLDSIRGMAEIAMDKTVAVGIHAEMLKELAQYGAPKRKALEHSGKTAGTVPPVFVIDIGKKPQ
jgi:hypothetical protein